MGPWVQGHVPTNAPGPRARAREPRARGAFFTLLYGIICFYLSIYVFVCLCIYSTCDKVNVFKYGKPKFIS